jgi:hypothetical protein
VTAGSKDLWIDAVCIDQENVNERSQQVRLMGRIYPNAYQTFAYIGEADEHSKAVESWCKRHLSSQDTLLTKDDLIYLNENDRRYVGFAKLSYKQHAVLLQARSWFKRTWVIQEVLLSKKLIVLAGNNKIEWVALSMLAGWQGNVVDAHTSFRVHAEGEPSGQYTQIKKARDFQIRHSTCTIRSSCEMRQLGISTLVSPNHLMDYDHLFHLMCETHSYACADPRDKLFGLLSLFHGDIPVGLEPDYSCTLEEVYTAISRVCLCYGATTALSAACGVRSHSSLPTWVVDWRTDSAVRPFCNNHKGEVSSWFTEGSYQAGFSGVKPRHLVESLPGRGISIRGLRVESVAQIEKLTVDEILSRSRKLKTWPVTWMKRVYRDEHVCSCRNDVLSVLKRDEEIGFVPMDTKVGDFVCVFLGFRVSFLLRPRDNAWQLVGECYLPWLMEGQQVAHVDWNEAYNEAPPTPLENFCIY